MPKCHINLNSWEPGHSAGQWWSDAMAWWRWW